MSPNPANLPSDFIKRAKALLLPHVQREDDRDALLIEAFYIRDRALRFEIELGGNANTFTVRCIERLLERNCFGDKSHPLSTLLRAIPCGAEGEAEAEAESLSHLLDAGCADSSSSSPATTPAPTPPPDPITIVNNLTNVTINTGGGAYIEGDVQTGGDFVGRDQIRLATQSVELPAARRTPTVFICYSRADATVANRVVADLQTAGHACWLDASDINRGDEWVRSISEGINNSYAVVVLCSRASLQSRWVKSEILWAQQKGKRIYPVLLEDVTRDDDFFSLVSYQALSLQADYAAGMGALITALPKVEVLTPKSVTESAQVTPAITRRALELEYLDRLRFEELLNTDKYTPLAGSTSSATTIDLGAVVMRQEFEHIRWHEAMRETQPPRKFSNAVEELLTIRRAAVLGEPGAGKSTTLWKLARHLVDAAIDDIRQPIPLLIRLGKWTDPTQPLPEFIASVLGELGAHMPDLMREGRAALLLDGLNEIPVDQRDDKTAQARDFLKAKPQRDLIAIVTCREQDYSQDLQLDRVAITPLDPQRILEFAQRYLGDVPGEAFFWKLAGNTKAVWERWQRAGSSFDLFFGASDVPRENPNVYSSTSGADDEAWRKHILDTGSLIRLARNPYMLFMLVQVFVQDGDLPANRGKLFERFAETLLLREHLAMRDPRTRAVVLSTASQALISDLSRLAFDMQRQPPSPARRGAGGEGDNDNTNAQTTLAIADARRILTDAQLYLAASASFISLGDAVRFTHQLLQEYFTARHMQAEVASGRLRATDLWPPDRWWERTGWEEATILYAGLLSDDCTSALEWVTAANPEVAAQCIVRSGAHVPVDALMRITTPWVARLTDTQRYPDPRARAAVGRALGLIAPINGIMRDTRRGVALTPDPSPRGRGEMIPDIDWVNIPAGDFIYQDEKKRRRLPAFQIARYPVTHIQFHRFISDSDGFSNPKWWQGLSASDDHKRQPGEQRFKYWNHPRDSVSWYDAVAFCRWLSDKLGYEVALPTEHQWERAARSTDGREYPWGKGYKDGYANVYDDPNRIGQTTAVGIYPQGASPSPEGVLDLCGNVWEWCLNEYDKPARTQLEGDEQRVLRGGSWNLNLEVARAASRRRVQPDLRNNLIGFRVVRPS